MANEIKSTSLFDDIGNDEEFRKRYGEQIGSGMSAVIYARDGIAAKVFRIGQPKRQVYQEAFTMAVIAELGIPAPDVHGVETFCDQTVLLMEEVKGTSLLDIMQADLTKTKECIEKVVDLQVMMHKVVTTNFRPLRMVIHGNITYSPGLADTEKERLLDILSRLPDEYALCHGDFHGGNILSDGQSYKIIDWAEVACGSPAADACRSYLDYAMAGMGLEEMYLTTYCAATGRTRDEILDWLAVTAGGLYGYLSEEGKKIARPFF